MARGLLATKQLEFKKLTCKYFLYVRWIVRCVMSH
jgi:hypothetical protein